MYSAYILSLNSFLVFCKHVYPGTYRDDLEILESALCDPASPTEPKIVHFMMYMYAHRDLQDPDDFQVSIAGYVLQAS
jgi:hypothetical protein